GAFRFPGFYYSKVVHPLAVNLRHLLLGVTRPSHLLRRKRSVEPGHLRAAERDVRCAGVVLEVCSLFCTWDRHDVRTSVQEPGKRDLSRGRSLLLGQLA